MNLLLLAAVVPPIFLIVKTYQMDKIEPEPMGLIIKLFILGAVITIPAGIIESILEESVLSSILSPKTILFQLISNFCIIALAEEGLKYLVLKKVTWKHPAFNYHFDAIVYSVTVSLGFAALENIMYVGTGGIQVALLRAVTAIPGHCIFSIFMGASYGTAKYYDSIGDAASSKKFRRLAVFLPVLLHGFYDFTATVQSNAASLVFFIFVIVMDIVAYRKIRRLSQEDHTVV